MVYEGFCGPSYLARNRGATVEQLINMYVEGGNSGRPKAPHSLIGTPGLGIALWTLPKSPLRGVANVNGRVFAVSGTGLYEIFANGTFIDRGVMAGTAEPATISTNGFLNEQLFITAGDEGYCYNLTTNALTNPVHNCRAGGFLGGWFLYLDSLTHEVKNSALEDGTTWDPTDLFARNRAGDPWIGMRVIGELIWLWGPLTGEVWYNAGTAPVPFQPVPGGFFDVGTGSPWAGAGVADAPVWLGATSDGPAMVYRAIGQKPQPISTHAVEKDLQGLASIADAQSYSYQEEGHTFWVLNLASAKRTWVWDAATGLWHQRGWYDNAAGSFQAGRPNCSCFAFGKHIVGDRASGKLYAMSIDTYTDADGSTLRRVRRAPYLSAEERTLFHKRFTLDLEVGRGVPAGQGSVPKVMFSYSDNQGATWAYEEMMEVGAQGENGWQVYADRLGSARNRSYEISMTDPIPWHITAAYVDVEAGTH
jgi:hypothetical protein